MNKGKPSFLIENHDEALYLWRKAGIRAATLIHIDAHHDMWPPSEDGVITIGNYVFFALSEGIIKKVIWVVPDASWATPENRCVLREQVSKLVQSFPRPRRAIQFEDECIKTSILGKPFTVCALKELTINDEPVLLDIDVDYFLLPSVAGNNACEISGRLPWLWPAEFKLPALPGLLMTSIAYSVEGGTTPIEWKHLGDELQSSLTGATHTGNRCFECLRIAAIADSKGDEARAKEYLHQALEASPMHPAGHWHNAIHCVNIGEKDLGRHHYQRAIALDPSYGSAFNSRGLMLEMVAQPDQAELEYRKILVLNPQDGNAMVGLARISHMRGNISLAKELVERGVALNPKSVDGHRLLGYVLQEIGDTQGAIQAYERYFELLATGEPSFFADISTYSRHSDPEEVTVRNVVAHLYWESGDLKRSLEHFQTIGDRAVPNISLFSMRTKTAVLLLRCRHFSQSLYQLLRAFAAIPADSLRAARKITRIVRNVSGLAL